MLGMEQFINPDSIVALKSDLINLIPGQSVCISGTVFKKLTGDEITEFASDGRFMMGNLAANCIIDTAGGLGIFIKKPVAGVCVFPRSPPAVRLETQAVDTR